MFFASDIDSTARINKNEYVLLREVGRSDGKPRKQTRHTTLHQVFDMTVEEVVQICSEGKKLRNLHVKLHRTTTL